MQHIYVNFKRFDVPSSLGGVNRLGDLKSFSKTVVDNTIKTLETYNPEEVKFAHYYPEAQLLNAIESVGSSKALTIGSQSVFRSDIEKGKNFGAFTTNLPASAVEAIGCTSTIIGHCEERADFNQILSLGGNKDRKTVNTIFNDEIKMAQKHNLQVLYCIGEKAEEVDDWEAVLTEQLEIGLKDCDLSNVVIAYEPVWSIGPGKTPADKPYITKVAKLIKKVIGSDVAVIYGGGLKQANAEMLASIDEIDGGLIALTRFTGDFGFYPEEYLEIISLYMNAKKNK